MTTVKTFMTHEYATVGFREIKYENNINLNTVKSTVIIIIKYENNINLNSVKSTVITSMKFMINYHG